MLSLFPSLLSYQRLAPFILRVVLGVIFIYWEYRTFRNSSSTLNAKAVAIIEMIVGIFLVIGLWTQAAALVASIDLIIRLIERIQKRAFLNEGINYYLIMLAIAISLLVTGAGFVAFDLPL